MRFLKFFGALAGLLVACENPVAPDQGVEVIIRAYGAHFSATPIMESGHLAEQAVDTIPRGVLLERGDTLWVGYSFPLRRSFTGEVRVTGHFRFENSTEVTIHQLRVEAKSGHLRTGSVSTPSWSEPFDVAFSHPKSEGRIRVLVGVTCEAQSTLPSTLFLDNTTIAEFEPVTLEQVIVWYFSVPPMTLRCER